jgi:hypothetical protein
MSLHQLIEMVKPPLAPVEPGSSDKWVYIEQRLGTALPGDYRVYIASCGTGSFDDFVIPFTPSSVVTYSGKSKGILKTGTLCSTTYVMDSMRSSKNRSQVFSSAYSVVL